MLIECGLTFLNNLIENKMINDLYIFRSNKSLVKTEKTTIHRLFKKIHRNY